MKKRFMVIVLSLCIIFSCSGCALFQSNMNELQGNITGNTYTIDTFDTNGTLTTQMHGQKINVEGVIVEEKTYSDGTWGTIETLSSVLRINIDGHQLVSCGDTLIFYEDGLVPDVNFAQTNINSTSENIGDNTIIAGVVNQFKNMFGKPMVVVIKSQEGYPIYAFSGKSVYWDVPDDLPKFTKITIDGKQLYIHRATYQLIDLELID